MSEVEKKTKRTKKQRTPSEQAEHDRKKAERRSRKAANKKEAPEVKEDAQVSETPVETSTEVTDTQPSTDNKETPTESGSKGPSREELVDAYVKEHPEDPFTLAYVSANTRETLLKELSALAKTDVKNAMNAIVKASRKENKKQNKGQSQKKSQWTDFLKVWRSKNPDKSFKEALSEGKVEYSALKQDPEKLNQYLTS
jgi:hypothetical protein